MEKDEERGLLIFWWARSSVEYGQTLLYCCYLLFSLLYCCSLTARHGLQKSVFLRD
uniref:Uncharacterized protein n=1 Tax=Oryza brachyantha TaxID=4533 RepID=J3MD04_ORYBR